MNGLAFGITLALRDAFSARARMAERSMRALDRTTAASAQRMAANLAIIENGFMSALRAAGAGLAIGAAFAMPIREAAKFGRAMEEVASIADYATTNMAELRAEVLRQAFKYPVMPLDQARGLYYIISSGFTNAAEATKVLEASSSLATVGLTNTQTAADGLTSMLLSYKQSASDAEMVSNRLFETVRYGKVEMEELASTIGMVASAASVSGVTQTEMLAMYATLTLGGLSGSQAATYGRQIIMGIARPTVQSQRMAARYGFDWSLEHMKEVGLANFIEEAYQKVGGGGTRVGDFNSLLSGRQAYAGAAILAQQANRFRNIQAGIEDPYVTDQYGLRVSSQDRALRLMSNTVDFQLTRLKSSISAFGIALGESVKGPVLLLIRSLANVVGLLSQLLVQFPLLGKAVMTAGLAASFLLIAGAARQMVTLFMGPAFKGMVATLNKVLPAFFGTGGSFLAMVGTITRGFLALGVVFWLFRKAWENNVGGLADKVTSFVLVVRALGEAFANMKHGIASMDAQTIGALNKRGLLGTFLSLLAILYRVREFLKAVGEGIKMAFSTIGNVVKAAINAIADVVGIFSGAAGQSIRNWLEGMHFSYEDVESIRQVGRYIGIIIGGIAALWAASAGFRLVGGLTGLLMNGGRGVGAAFGAARGASAMLDGPLDALFNAVRNARTTLPGQMKALAISMATSFRGWQGRGGLADIGQMIWGRYNAQSQRPGGRRRWMGRGLLGNAFVGLQSLWSRPLGAGRGNTAFAAGPLKKSLQWLIGIGPRVATAFSAMSVAIRGFGLSSLVAARMFAFAMVRTAATAVWTFIRSATLAMMTNPITALVLVLGAAIYMLVKHWDSVKAAMLRFWNWLKSTRMGGWIANWLSKLGEGFKKLGGLFDRYLKQPFKTMMEAMNLRSRYTIPDNLVHADRSATTYKLLTDFAALREEMGVQGGLREALEGNWEGATQGEQTLMGMKRAYMRILGERNVNPFADPEKYAPANLPVPDVEGAVAEGTEKGIKAAARSGGFIFDIGNEQYAQSSPYSGYEGRLGARLTSAASAKGRHAGASTISADLEALVNLFGGHVLEVAREMASRPISVQIEGREVARAVNVEGRKNAERSQLSAGTR